MVGHRSPEDAAMAGFPPRYCRVVASRVEENDAFVLLDTGSANQPYLYGVHCARRNGEWYEGSSSNGGGWSLTELETKLGTWSLWDDVPPDTDMVRVEFDGQVSEHPVIDGVYLVVWFRQPSAVGPSLLAKRINGEWVDQPDWRAMFSDFFH